MDIPKSELFAVLQEFNPWWSEQSSGDLPDWERTAMKRLRAWAMSSSKRALLLSGARQTGKTTLFRQLIRQLVSEKQVEPSKILYATFDHPILKLAGLEKTLAAWAELFPTKAGDTQWLFLDEIQYVDDWQVWVKHQVDFKSHLRIALTGSASPLRDGSTESGVGRWETLPLPTLSFGEYLSLRQVELDPVPVVSSLIDCFEWSAGDFARATRQGQALVPHFHEYLLRGGFPEPALTDDLTRCQRLLREDIVDKVLKRDMTALYGVRRIIELEKIFLYLCYHDGGILDIAAISRELDGITRESVSKFLDLFESTHLIYRLRPYGYGKDILRGKTKVYLADAALPGSVLLLGRRLLKEPKRLGAAVETAFFKHVFTRYYADQPTFSYSREKTKELEVDLVAEVGARIVPFEVKYQDAAVTPGKLKGLCQFLEKNGIEHGYVITRRWEDFRILDEWSNKNSRILAVPAALACYWLSL
ncbi:ATP-binding protein [Roseibacillus persicicus]|uniref:ATPase n=1 Tax=Roseibacillus persicicus TaxID=454148 RepID=A0A918TRK4_9BACT|nr:ATP-binding protein [Roseibacillus persicicus]GHC53671.1 ATPase [Roseibacillus persicicus]